MNAPSPSADEPLVRVLPEALSNQIAAGEVVERPASVVKELVENALDAGASRVFVDIEAAGKGLIRVLDDGSGMTERDAATAILRHATSKVRTATDLEAIGTLGFRGEALPSIASVSRFLLVTRRAEAEHATTVRIEGGSQATLGVMAAPPGTRIEVRDLFWNVPARLKFLKTDATETQHVVELVKGFALGHPHVHFRLGTGGRAPALDFPAVRRLYERVTQVLGKDVATELYEVALPGPPVRVTGFVSGPRGARSTVAGMTCFVNGRRVKDRVLHHALVSAFGAELGPGRFPQAVLWIHLDPTEVDVNVHPAKAEVRFRQAEVIHDAVVRAVQAMLRRRPWAAANPLPLERALAGELVLDEPTAPAHERRSQNQPEPRPTPPREPAMRALEAAPKAPDRRAPEAPPPPSRPAAPRLAEPIEPYPSRPRPEPPEHATTLSFGARATALFEGPPRPPAEPRIAPRPTPPPPPRVTPAPLPTAHEQRPRPPAPAPRLIGALGRRAEATAPLLLAEDELGLIAVDPRATAELWVLRELHSPRPPQPLLIPARLDLAPHEARAIEGRLPELRELGLWIEPFGGPTFQVLGLPPAAIGASPVRVLEALAALFGRQPQAPLDAVMRALAAAGADPAKVPEDELVRRALLLGDAKDTRDHRGRRPYIRLASTELDRRFEG